MVFVTEDFARATAGLHGEAGRLWLRNLPALVAECAARWSLKVFPPFPALTYNYAAPAEGPDGARLVLKVGVPVRELLTEIEALRVFDGRGAVRLVESDAAAGALLLERLEPGTPLTSLCDGDDEAATSAAASVMRKLWRPAPDVHTFPTVADWGEGFRRLRERFGGGTGPLPRRLFEEAEALFAELLGSSAEAVLLHGDLHHGNVLAAARGPWLAIDPKGLVGEPAYEVSALLRNPMPLLLELPRPVSASERRVARLSEELGIERARLRGWALSQAALSVWWTFEDAGVVDGPGIAVAEMLAATNV